MITITIYIVTRNEYYDFYDGLYFHVTSSMFLGFSSGRK